MRGRLVFVGLCSALIAGTLAVMSAPASAVTKTTCSSGKIVNRNGSITQPLVTCNNAAATGAKGTAAFTVRTARTTITWNRTGSTLLKFTRKAQPRPNKCPSGRTLYLFSGSVLSGKGAAAKGFPKGSTLTERMCINLKTLATTLYPASSITIRPPTTTTPTTTTTTAATTTTSTTTTTTTPTCGPIATSLSYTVGSDGFVWMVVVPASFPACATHPTGSMSNVHFTNSGCGNYSGTLSDSGSNLSADVTPVPANLWGIDTGLTVSTFQVFSCGALVGTYTGDTTYLGF